MNFYLLKRWNQGRSVPAQNYSCESCNFFIVWVFLYCRLKRFTAFFMNTIGSPTLAGMVTSAAAPEAAKSQDLWHTFYGTACPLYNKVWLITSTTSNHKRNGQVFAFLGEKNPSYLRLRWLFSDSRSLNLDEISEHKAIPRLPEFLMLIIDAQCSISL